MKRWRWAAGLALMWLVGCGKGGSLPMERDDPSSMTPDGSVALPDAGTPPDAGVPSDGGDPSPDAGTAPTSLWPLTPGSRWTYRISDPLRGVFEKHVEVLGPRAVPKSNVTAIAVRSLQPYLEELSWQLESGGVVFRLREEDRKHSVLVRETTWRPAAMKALAGLRPMGWSFDSAVQEVTQHGDGSREEKERLYVWRVVAVNETVTTPAGTFSNAIRLFRDRADKENRGRTYWLVPGIGKVREEGERLEELMSYDVKK